MSLFRSCSFYKMHSWNRNCGIGTACRLDVLFYAVADDLIKNITFYAYMKNEMPGQYSGYISKYDCM